MDSGFPCWQQEDAERYFQHRNDRLFREETQRLKDKLNELEAELEKKKKEEE